MNELNKIISANLTRLIEQKGVQQKDVAEAIGVTPQALNIWVKGGAVPRIGKVQRLADYFGVNKTDIIEEHKPVEAFEQLNKTDIIKNAFKQSGFITCELTDDEIIDIIKYAEFIVNKRAK